jgi:hypothetical protein
MKERRKPTKNQAEEGGNGRREATEKEMKSKAKGKGKQN